MKKHEHPTNRLEKMSNFFGGGNFSKLNLYKATLFLTLLMTCSAVFADLQVDFSKGSKEMEIKQHRVIQNGKLRAKVWNWNPKDKTHKPMEDVTLSFEDGALKIDASACKPDAKGSYGVFVIEVYSPTPAADAKIHAGKTMRAAATIKTDRPQLAILTPSYRTGENTFFHRGGNTPLLPKWEAVSREFLVRNDISGEPYWRLTFEEPAVIHLRSASLTFPEPELSATVVTGNQILNGGAERGWYAVSGSNYSNLNGGVYRDWLGVIWEKDMRVFLDDREAASGRYSFRLEDGGRQYQNWFRFNPVKFTPGKRAVITFKAKAKEGTSSLMLFLAVNTSQGYRKYFEVGREWRTYRFEIPEFGQPVGNISGVYQAKGDNQVYPTFWVNKTIWLDDLCYWQGEGETPFENPEPVAVSGEIDRPYQALGGKLSAAMRFRNTTGQALPLEISYEIKDFQGQTVERGTLGAETLSAGGERMRTYSFQVTRRGSQTLTFRVKAGEKTVEHGFLFGGIGPESDPVKRLALDTDARATAEFLLPFFRDMRIGTARFWSKLSGENPVGIPALKPLHDAGIQIYVNLGLDGDARYHSFSRHDLSGWRESIRTYLMPDKDSIDVYEILNEPNIWNGYMKNPDSSIYKEMSPQEYVRIAREAKNIIAEFAPQAKIAGPTTCKTDIGFTDAVLRAGGDKYLDIITEHPYRASAEMPDYYAELQNLKKVRASFGNKPHWATESGWRSEEMLNHNQITDYVRNSVSLNIRNILTAFAGGAEVYTIFAMSAWGGASSWQMTLTGGTGKLYEYAPQPVLFAMRAVADLIGDAKPAGTVFLGFDFKCYLFDNGKERIATLWRWNGASGRILRKPEYQGVFYDVMGNEIVGEIEIGRQPVYFKTALTAKELAALCTRFVPDGERVSCHTEISVTGVNTFDALVTNRGLDPLVGYAELTVAGEKQRTAIKGIAPGETLRLPFRTPAAISAEPTKATLALELNEQRFKEAVTLKSLFVPRIKPITVDGNLDEWSDIPGITLNFEQNGVTANNAVWSNKDKTISAEIKTAWNEDGFCLAVTVHKDGFFPDDRSVAWMWNGDSLQVAFDPLKNARSNNRTYDGDDFEYSLGEFRKQAAVYRANASLSLYDSLEKTLGELKNDEVQLAVKHLPGETVYEARFAPRAVSPFKLEEGSSMRFNLLVNVNNGKQRLGWLELTPGIGQYKSPGEFMDFRLLK